MFKVIITNIETKQEWFSTFKTSFEANNWLQEQIGKPNRDKDEIEYKIINTENNINKEREYMEKCREQRDKMLKNTDYTQLADSPIDTKLKKKYREYRQYLRDIPDMIKNKQKLNYKVLSFKEWHDVAYRPKEW